MKEFLLDDREQRCKIIGEDNCKSPIVTSLRIVACRSGWIVLTQQRRGPQKLSANDRTSALIVSFCRHSVGIDFKP